MSECRWCGREGLWPFICMSTRDMEEKPNDPICDATLLKLGGGERIVNQQRADAMSDDNKKGIRWCSCKASARGFGQHMAWCPAADAKCAACGHEKGEHHYNGSAYGVCGKFVSRADAMSDSIDTMAACAALTVLTRYGIPQDVQEWLVYGRPELNIKAGALSAALAGALRIYQSQPVDPQKLCEILSELETSP